MLLSQDINFSDDQQKKLQRQLADKITNYASIDEIRMLLICGAQPDGAVTRGLTPLHYACFINYFAAAKLLLNKGAKIVLDAGASVNAIHTYIGSALHLAACSMLSNQFEILRMLLERGADVNLQHTFPDGSKLKSPFVEYFRSRDTTIQFLLKVDAKVVHLLLSYGGRVVMRSPIHDSRGQLRNMLRLAVTREQPDVR
uniref:ANK_REP_REGION domain-containing protein n=1 Tax=Heterorhabditis bacteriophora TaxID=37862 RepID=A0A1I7XSS1_HETBA